MVRRMSIFLLIMSIQGCSFLVDMAFYNNSDHPIEICNLNLTTPKCQTIQAKTLAKITLVGNKKMDAWNFSISSGKAKKMYTFKFGQYPEHASEIYCDGVFQEICDIPIQYEQNGWLYWGGKDKELPVREFPKQPKGFPAKPGT